MKADWMQEQISKGKDRYEESKKDGKSFGPPAATFYESTYLPSTAKPSENKDRISSWVALWPLSTFLFFFDDLLVRFFHAIYDLFGGMFERITKNNI